MDDNSLELVIALVRKRGAIGVFYPKAFSLDNATLDNYKEMWFAQYGQSWELHHFLPV